MTSDLTQKRMINTFGMFFVKNIKGDFLATSTNYFDFTVTTIILDTEIAHLDYNWGKLTALKEKYGNDVTITGLRRLGSVLITS